MTTKQIKTRFLMFDFSKVAVAGRCERQRWSYYIHWSSSHLRPRIVKLILSDHCKHVWLFDLYLETINLMKGHVPLTINMRRNTNHISTHILAHKLPEYIKSISLMCKSSIPIAPRATFVIHLLPSRLVNLRHSITMAHSSLNESSQMSHASRHHRVADHHWQAAVP